MDARDVGMLTESIDAHLHRNIALSELAQMVDLSPSHLCRAFKQATGRPPHQFQIERRIERAKVLLQRSDLRLVEVAMELGFSTRSQRTPAARASRTTANTWSTTSDLFGDLMSSLPGSGHARSRHAI